MRRTVLILILALGCSSSPPVPRRITMDLYEWRPGGQKVAVLGPHQYIVQIRNLSNEAFTVESLLLEPPAGVRLDGGLDTSQWLVEPGQAINVEMSTNIAIDNYDPNAPLDITVFRVTATCTSDSGNFTDTETLNVRPLRRG